MSDTLRIGYVVRMFPRFSETFVVQEILELERQGVEVVVFSLKKPDEGRFHPSLSHVKGPVIYLEDYDPRKWTSWLPKMWKHLSPHVHRLWDLVTELLPKGEAPSVDLAFTSAALAARAIEMGVQALHAHFATVSCTAAYYAHRITGVPYSFTAHAKDIFSDNVDRDLLTQKVNAARFAVTVSNYNRRFLTEALPGADAVRIRVLYNGIDLNYFAKREQSDGVPPPLILGVGRLVAKKGFADLVAACATLRDNGLDFRCLIVGQGREEARLNAAIAQHRLDGQVALTGPLTQNRVRDLMTEAAVFCLPCIRDVDGNQDALPTVLLESMARGVPVISTRLAGIPEIVEDGTSGLLVEPNDFSALAAALQRVLTSVELRQSFAEKGRERAERLFNVANNVGTLKSWFAEAHAACGPPQDDANHRTQTDNAECLQSS